MNPCRICTSPLRIEIEVALHGGESLRAVASRFGLSKDALHRHKVVHLEPRQAQRAETPSTATVADNTSTATKVGYEAFLQRLAQPYAFGQIADIEPNVLTEAEAAGAIYIVLNGWFAKFEAAQILRQYREQKASLDATATP